MANQMMQSRNEYPSPKRDVVGPKRPLMNRRSSLVRPRPWRIAPYLFILPFYVTFALFWLAPIVGSFAYSFTDWYPGQNVSFIGLENYVSLFRDPRFFTALKNTLLFAVVYVGLVTAISVTIGIILNAKLIRLKGIFRSAFFAPITVSIAVVAIIFSMMYARDIGPINLVLNRFGIPSVGWLSDPHVALWSIVILRVWRVVGYYAAIVLAGLQTISPELAEAATVDGASELQIVRSVTIPLLRPVILFIIVTCSIWSLMLFDEPWILTRGGPMDATLTLGVYLYQQGFESFKLGYSAAVSYVITVLILGASLIQNRVLRTEDLA